MNKKNPNAAWGLISVIVSELVMAPLILGAGAYFLIGHFVENKSIQLIGALGGSMVGMIIAFYRINQISKKWDDKS